MTNIKRKKAAEEQEYFVKVIDQQKVTDITVDFFYRSHTASLLVLLLIGLLLIAFLRNDSNVNNNCYHGAIAVCGIFLALSTMILPNGPFTRPHPIIWRMIFGASLLYFLLLVFVLFMKLEDAKAVLYYIDPALAKMTINDILDKEYAVNCSDLTIERFYNHLDIFALAHFLGWVVKAILLRHYWLTWLLSINWEITELAHCHMMPNFCECWWDSLILDVIICNGLGIYVGMKIVQWLEMRAFHWESIRTIQTTTGKIKRLMLQFTPASWDKTRWFGHDSTVKRGILLSVLVFIWQFAELNSFFIKHVFIMKPCHPLTLARLGLVTLISAPGIRQFYLYVTDPMINRMGSQLWMFLAVIMTEFVVCFKFGFETFNKTIIKYMVFWVIWLVFSSFLMVFGCIWCSQKTFKYQSNYVQSNGNASTKSSNVSQSHSHNIDNANCDLCDGTCDIVRDGEEDNVGVYKKLLARVVRRVSNKLLNTKPSNRDHSEQMLELHPINRSEDEEDEEDEESQQLLEDGDVIRCRLAYSDDDGALEANEDVKKYA